jgi:hypothetical protein
VDLTGLLRFQAAISVAATLDVGITSVASTDGSVVYGTESLTEQGDSGALYVDALTGCPIAMHHCLQNPNLQGPEDLTKGYISLGFR